MQLTCTVEHNIKQHDSLLVEQQCQEYFRTYTVYIKHMYFHSSMSLFRFMVYKMSHGVNM